MIYSWKSSSQNQGGTAEEHEFHVFDIPSIFQIIMWHAKLWEDDFSQQAESSIKLKSMLESIKSENLRVWVKKQTKEEVPCQFQDKERTTNFPFFYPPLSILLLFPGGQVLLTLPLSSHWSAYLQSPSLEEVIWFHLNAQALHLLHLPLPLTRNKKKGKKKQNKAVEYLQ